MTATLYRPDVESWRHAAAADHERRLDAVAAFERQREATLRMERLVQFWMAVGCFAAALAIVLAVTR